ncbi:MAG: SdrD B-like domain-containing protein [Beijerinckiaceae bacterium]|jgi:SdrD B-like domain
MAISFVVGDDPSEVNSGSTPLQVKVTITETDANSDGFTDLKVDLEVVQGNVADLRGFFFNVANDALLSQLNVTGDDITDAPVFDTDGDGVPEISSASPPQPEAVITPYAFEAGLELGTPGMADDDIAATSFVISAPNTNLTTALLEGQQIGVRATSVGEDREGSSKLIGEVPPQEEAKGRIEGVKYEDSNDNDAIDGQDATVSGWEVSLYLDENGDGDADADELVATTTTNANGAYAFADLAAGDYIVVEGTRDGWTNVLDDSVAVDLAAGETEDEIHFLNDRVEEPPCEDGDFDWSLDVGYDFDSQVASSFDIEATYAAAMNVDAAVDIDVAVVGNLVSFFMDVQAVGADGATQTSVAVVTTEDYASFVAGGYSAVA